jgi:Lar family restriction alleviation protein
MKPCPFCGSEIVKLVTRVQPGRMDGSSYSVFVECQDCHARGPNAWNYGNEAEVKDQVSVTNKWQNRV